MAKAGFSSLLKLGQQSVRGDFTEFVLKRMAAHSVAAQALVDNYDKATRALNFNFQSRGIARVHYIELVDNVISLYVYTYHKLLMEESILAASEPLKDYTIRKKTENNAMGSYYKPPDVPSWLDLPEIVFKANPQSPNVETGELSSKLKKFIEVKKNKIEAGVYWDDSETLRNGELPSVLANKLEFGTANVPARPVLLRVGNTKFFTENYRKIIKEYNKRSNTVSEPRIGRQLRRYIRGV